MLSSNVFLKLATVTSGTCACLLVTNAPSTYARPAPAAAPLPPAAMALAYRLHFLGSPVVGNQPQGNAGPWLIWARPDLHQASRILSAGPLGAGARFDYFDLAAAPIRGGPDRRGALPAAAATRIAIRWL